MMPANKEAFNFLSDDIVELFTKNDALKKKKGEYDEKWLRNSKDKLLKQMDDKKSKFNYVWDEKLDE